jgi:hypothetical protein
MAEVGNISTFCHLSGKYYNIYSKASFLAFLVIAWVAIVLVAE